MSEVVDVELDEKDIHRQEQLGISYGLGNLRIRTAIVATNTRAIRVSRLHQKLTKSLGLKEIEIFETLEQATHWLGLSLPNLLDEINSNIVIDDVTSKQVI